MYPRLSLKVHCLTCVPSHYPKFSHKVLACFALAPIEYILEQPKRSQIVTVVPLVSLPLVLHPAPKSPLRPSVVHHKGTVLPLKFANCYLPLKCYKIIHTP